MNKTALKIVLALTFPLWVVPAIIAIMVGAIGMLIWACVSDMVDGPARPPYDD